MLEERIRAALEGDETGEGARLSSRDVSEICRAIEAEMKKTAAGRPPLALFSAVLIVTWPISRTPADSSA